MDLGMGVRAAMRRKQTSRALMGTVAAIDPVNLSIDLDIGAGDLITGVRWIEPYAPAVGHLVVALRVGSGWWVLGKNSKDLTAPPPEYVTVTAAPELWWVNQRGFQSGQYQWSASTETVVQGGFRGGYSGGSFARYGPLTDLIPPGGIVTSAKITFLRNGGMAGFPISPVIYRHSLASMPPDSVLPTNLVIGSPWRPGALIEAERGTWDVPSAFLTDLLSGLVKGIAVWSTGPQEFATFTAGSGLLSITYMIPQ